MKKRIDHTNNSNEETNSEDDGYPMYPVSDDVYSKSARETDINLEDMSKVKQPNEHFKAGKRNEKDFDEDKSGSDLDVPGSELDDEQEEIGSEDEENNYYSLGDDNNIDVEDDKGE